MVFAGFRYAENFEMDVGGMRISIRPDSQYQYLVVVG